MYWSPGLDISAKNPIHSYILEGECILQGLPDEFISGTGHNIACKAVLKYCGNRVWGGYAYKYPKKK